MRFVDEHKEQWGIEPLCRMVKLASSTYYGKKGRAPSSRSVSDEKWRHEITRIHAENRGVYGVNKVWASLKREGHCVARCTVERLMKSLGLQGVIRGKGVRTTIPDELAERPEDLVARDFRAFAPHRLWVADITYVKTHSGWVYVIVTWNQAAGLNGPSAPHELRGQRHLGHRTEGEVAGLRPSRASCRVAADLDRYRSGAADDRCLCARAC